MAVTIRPVVGGIADVGPEEKVVCLCSPHYVHVVRPDEARAALITDPSIVLAFEIARCPLGWTKWALYTFGIIYLLHNIAALVYDIAINNVDSERLCIQFFLDDRARLLITMTGWVSVSGCGVVAPFLMKRTGVGLGTGVRYTLYCFRNNTRLVVLLVMCLVTVAIVVPIQPALWDPTQITAALLSAVLPWQDILMMRGNTETRKTLFPAHLAILFVCIRLQLTDIAMCKAVPTSIFVRVLTLVLNSSYMLVYAENMILVFHHLVNFKWWLPSTVRYLPAYVCKNIFMGTDESMNVLDQTADLNRETRKENLSHVRLYASEHFCHVIDDRSGLAQAVRQDPSLSLTMPFVTSGQRLYISITLATTSILTSIQVILTIVDGILWWPHIFDRTHLCLDRYGVHQDVDVIEASYPASLKKWQLTRQPIVFVSYALIAFGVAVIPLISNVHALQGMRNMARYWWYSIRLNTRVVVFAGATICLAIAMAIIQGNRVPTVQTAVATVIFVFFLPLLDVFFMNGRHFTLFHYFRVLFLIAMLLTCLRVLFDLSALCPMKDIVAKMIYQAMVSAQGLLAVEGIVFAAHHARRTQWWSPAFIRFSKARTSLNAFRPGYVGLINIPGVFNPQNKDREMCGLSLPRKDDGPDPPDDTSNHDTDEDNDTATATQLPSDMDPTYLASNISRMPPLELDIGPDNVYVNVDPEEDGVVM